MAQTRLHVDGKRVNLREMLGKLTPKQRKFAEGLVLEGLTKAEAYRRAYEWNGKSDRAMRNNASVLAKHNGVAMAVKAMEAEKTARIWENRERFQNWILQGITDTANNTESDITRLKALELAGRTRFASVFEEPQANESNAQLAGSITDLIAAKLSGLLSQSLAAPNLGDADVVDTTCDHLPLSDTVDPGTPTGGGEGE